MREKWKPRSVILSDGRVFNELPPKQEHTKLKNQIKVLKGQLADLDAAIIVKKARLAEIEDTIAEIKSK